MVVFELRFGQRLALEEEGPRVSVYRVFHVFSPLLTLRHLCALTNKGGHETVYNLLSRCADCVRKQSPLACGRDAPDTRGAMNVSSSYVLASTAEFRPPPSHPIRNSTMLALFSLLKVVPVTCLCGGIATRCLPRSPTVGVFTYRRGDE